MTQYQRDRAYELYGLIQGYSFIASEDQANFELIERIQNAYEALLRDMGVLHDHPNPP